MGQAGSLRAIPHLLHGTTSPAQAAMDGQREEPGTTCTRLGNKTDPGPCQPRATPTPGLGAELHLSQQHGKQVLSLRKQLWQVSLEMPPLHPCGTCFPARQVLTWGC